MTALLAITWPGCDWPRANPQDPGRCGACTAPQVCINGRCVKPDAAVDISPVYQDGRQRDVTRPVIDAVVKAKDKKAKLDQVVAPDQTPPATSSYGQLCNAKNLPKGYCPDGKHQCFESIAAKSGFCTRGCKSNADCTAGLPTGTFAVCDPGYSGKPVCTFICKGSMGKYSCPKGFTCDSTSKYTNFCWPASPGL